MLIHCSWFSHVTDDRFYRKLLGDVHNQCVIRRAEDLCDVFVLCYFKVIYPFSQIYGQVLLFLNDAVQFSLFNCVVVTDIVSQPTGDILSVSKSPV